MTDAVEMLVCRVNPVVLVGAPGVGKTSLVREAARRYAEERGLVFVDLTSGVVSVDGCKGPLHDVRVRRCLVRLVERDPDRFMLFYRMVMSHVLPEDLLGVPRVDSETSTVVYHKPLPVHLMTVEGVHGVLFLDEVSSVARDDVRSLLYAMLDERRVGDVVLSSRVFIVASGNRLGDDDSVEPLPAPIVNRAVVVHVVPPSIEEWGEYMDGRYERWWSDALGYLLLRPSLFQGRPARSRLTGYDSFPSPRSWEKLAGEVMVRACRWNHRRCSLASFVVGRRAWEEVLRLDKLAARMGIDVGSLADVAVEDLLVSRPGLVVEAPEVAADMVAYDVIVRGEEGSLDTLADVLAKLRGSRLDVEGVIARIEALMRVSRELGLELARRLSERDEGLDRAIRAYIERVVRQGSRPP
ncbi:ATP-binding protein [Pyrolobus fumarii]|uniref:ATP-binding protein n=1 Tax=Pyrolobus fumarii TaxID=54252 RepID=UPI00064F80EE|nr:AAA family ATPase [Pyrolobus fumarii]